MEQSDAMAALEKSKSINGEGRRILVVDDDLGQRSLLSSFLNRQGFEAVPVGSAEEALARLAAESFGMMVSDVRMPGMTGFDALREARRLHPRLPVLLVTAYPQIHDAVEAMRDGALNYLEKPIDLEELLNSVRQGLGLRPAHAAPAIPDLETPAGLVAHSAAMRAVVQEIAMVAPSESRLMITGESGVGKEVVAELAHAWSQRSKGILVKVNCAAIPETLLESELFGHEKGAFTGAIDRRIGRFEEAIGGTIFLDEIAEMSPPLQARLLRVTQDGSFQRVGSNKEIRSDARIIAATNRNLEKEIEAGRFREDLFFRLNVFEIYIPPLRERRADILPLAHHFLETSAARRPRLSSAASAALEFYDWPGNARELKNAMERAALIARGEVILPDHLPRRIREQSNPAALGGEGATGDRRLDDVERTMILNTLREMKFNRSETARRLGISRRALHYKLRRYADEGHQIDPDPVEQSRSD